MSNEDTIRAQVRAELEREAYERELAEARARSREDRAAAAVVAQDVEDGRAELRLRFTEQGWPEDLVDDLKDDEVLRSTGRPVPEPTSTSPQSIAPRKNSATSGSFVSDPREPEANSLEANIRRAEGES